MNKIYMSLVIIFLTVFTGCSSKDPKADEKIVTVFDSCMIQGVEAPKWVCGDATAQNVNQLFDVGSATISKLGTGFTQKEAAENGKTKLQEQIEALAQEKIVLFIRRAQLDPKQDVDKAFVFLLSKRIGGKVIKKARVSEYWKNYYLNLAYAQVVVKKESFKNITQREVLLEIRQKSAYWEIFKDNNSSQILQDVLNEI